MTSVWNTQAVTEAEQFNYWRDAISRAFVPLEPERDVSLGFSGRIDALGLDTLRASVVAADSHHVRLSRSGIARQHGNPFFVNLLRHGHAVVSQNGNTCTARPGDVYVVDSSAPWDVVFASDFEMLCIEIDEALLRPRLGSRGRLVTPVLADARVLSRYMTLIGELSADEAFDAQPLMLDHCAALLARANAGAQGDSASQRDQRASLHSIVAFMDSHLTDPTLSPDSTCQALRISRSYLFKVLMEAGHTFEGYVRGARLRGCRAALLRHRDMPIAQLAANWGFNETSSFNRAYRREFGQTPSQSRFLDGEGT